MRIVRLQYLLLWACVFTLASLFEFASATTSATTPSPTSTSSPATPAPTVASTTPAPTDAPTSSSTSSNTRAATVAWALFTIAVCVALLILLYNREQGKRRRIHHGESLRTNLAGADALQPNYNHLPPPEERDPTMSSF